MSSENNLTTLKKVGLTLLYFSFLVACAGMSINLAHENYGIGFWIFVGWIGLLGCAWFAFDPALTKN